MSDLEELYQQRRATPTDMRAHLATLHDLVLGVNAQQVIELGGRGGESTIAFLAALEQTGGRLWSCDIEGTRAPVMDLLGQVPHWACIVADDRDALVAAPTEADVLLIDTSHEYEHTLWELEHYGPLVRDGGYILVHDAEQPGVWQALRECLRARPEWMYHVVERSMKLALIRVLDIGKLDIGDQLVSVVIPAAGNVELTRRCIETLRDTARLPVQVILADNGSTKEESLELSALGVDVYLNLGKKLVGFPRAINTGIRAAWGQYVMLLNNDTEMKTVGWDRRLVNTLEHSRASIVSPVTNFIANPTQRRGMAKPHVALADMLFFVCVMMRRELVDQVGFLDEDFGLGNWEDAEFCERVKMAGGKLVVEPDVFVYHVGHQTFKQLGQEKFDDLLQANQALFARKRERVLGIGDSDSSIPDSPIPSPVTYCGRVMAGFPRRPHAPGAVRDWHERAVITAMQAGLVARKAGRESYRTDVNRNDLGKELMGMPPEQAEWLWMCDEDVIPPPPAVIHMVKRATEIGADILVALVLTRDGRPIFFHEFTGFRPDDWGIEIPRFEAAFEFVADFLAKHEPKPPWSDSRIPAEEACIKLVGCGTGCILIHRRVFEQMPGPWFIHWAGKIPGTEIYATGGGTEDLGFSYRATQLHGFRIYGDASIFCEHLDTIGMGAERFWTAWREIQRMLWLGRRPARAHALARSETGQSTSQTNLEEVQHGR